MRSLTGRRCRGRRPRRPAEVSGGGRYAGGMNFSPYGLPVSGSWPEGCGGVKTPPYDAKDKGVAMARRRAGHARPLRTVIKWDVGRPAPRPSLRLAAMRSLTVCRCRGRLPRRPAEVSGGGRYAGGMNFSPYGLPVSGSWPEGCGGVKTPPYDAKDKGWQWRGSVNGLRTRGAREGGSPPLCSWRAVARERVATHSPSESPSHLTVTAPFDKGAFASPLRGFGGTPGF